MRLIDGDALIAWIKESQHMTSKMRNIICKVETMPSADRPQGEWIVHGEAPIYIKECSVCGAKFFHHATEDLTPFCAMCGCRMKGADDE